MIFRHRNNLRPVDQPNSSPLHIIYTCSLSATSVRAAVDEFFSTVLSLNFGMSMTSSRDYIYHPSELLQYHASMAVMHVHRHRAKTGDGDGAIAHHFLIPSSPPSHPLSNPLRLVTLDIYYVPLYIPSTLLYFYENTQNYS